MLLHGELHQPQKSWWGCTQVMDRLWPTAIHPKNMTNWRETAASQRRLMSRKVFQCTNLPTMTAVDIKSSLFPPWTMMRSNKCGDGVFPRSWDYFVQAEILPRTCADDLLVQEWKNSFAVYGNWATSSDTSREMQMRCHGCNYASGCYRKLPEKIPNGFFLHKTNLMLSTNILTLTKQLLEKVQVQCACNLCNQVFPEMIIGSPTCGDICRNGWQVSLPPFITCVQLWPLPCAVLHCTSHVRKHLLVCS